MGEFCNICNTEESGVAQINGAEVGTTVMYLLRDSYIFGFATVVNKSVVEDAVIINGVMESSTVNCDKSHIIVVPYGCNTSNEAARFRLNVFEFMIFSPDDEDIEEQMKYTKSRCIGIYEY